MGQLHDFGKYSLLFEEVLEHERVHVNHAVPGAAVVYERYGGKKAARMLAIPIAAHHSELCEGTALWKRVLSGDGEPYDNNGDEISLYGRQALADAFDVFCKEIAISSARPVPPDYCTAEDQDLAYMLYERMLFSALVDADYSASAEHFAPDYLATHTGAPLDAQKAWARLLDLRSKKQRDSHAKSAINAVRDQLFADCKNAAEKPPGLFTLTAPTGTGKTLSLLAFAIQHAKKWGKRRIILILPYLALAEQSAKDYRYVFPDLLESHSAAQLSEESRLLAERWDAACILTTTVGFFEPLFAARPASCRRLHQIANSIIVLDEAQSLPATVLDATLRTVKELCERYGCSFVFSTATQPSYQYRPQLSWTPHEIVPNPQSLFAATRRARVSFQIGQATPLEQIAAQMAAQSSCCAILNLRRHARKLFHLLQEICKKDSLFFMTTDLCLAHRRTIMAAIKARINAGLPCRLVATQCIEAGVDLDFPVLYRALAPLEAIIQAAGRCNRNGDTADGLVIVFVPDEEGRLYPDFNYERAANCVKLLLSRSAIDCCNLADIARYYEQLYPDKGGDCDELRQAIQERDFHAAAEAYHLIKAPDATVVVPYPPEIALFKQIRDMGDSGQFTERYMQAARKITVSVYNTPALRDLCTPIPIRLPNGQLAQAGWYLLGDAAHYREDTGLALENDSAQTTIHIL